MSVVDLTHEMAEAKRHLTQTTSISKGAKQRAAEAEEETVLF
jgi:hypothetical protein